MDLDDWIRPSAIKMRGPEDLTTYLAAFGITYLFGVIAVSLLIDAPYGKYANDSWWTKPLLSTRWSWVVQEAAAFLTCAATTSGKWSGLDMKQKVVLGAFMLHYFHRYKNIRQIL